jgi:hypothetical protein
VSDLVGEVASLLNEHIALRAHECWQQITCDSLHLPADEYVCRGSVTHRLAVINVQASLSGHTTG